MKQFPILLMLWLFLAISAAAQSVPGTGDKGAMVLVISEWSAGCTGSTIPVWDNECDAWYDEIRNGDPEPAGHASRAWWADGFYHNGGITDPMFCDPNLVTWGTDYQDDHADEPDALMVGLHGWHGSSTSKWCGKVRVDASCGTDCNCAAHQEHMEFDYDVDFLHLNSCHSMCEQNWFDEWPDSFKGVLQVTGFHGLGYAGPTGIWEDFADDAFYIGTANAWIDNLYRSCAHWTLAGGCDEQCPVALTAGSSGFNASTRTTFMSYAFVYPRLTSPSSFEVVFTSGCDPTSEPPISSK